MPQIDALPDDENGAPITRRFISHAILYLQDSPAGMFLCWAIGSNSTRKPSGIDSQQTEHDQQNASTKAFEGMCYEVDKTDGPSPCFPTYKMHLANRQCEQGAQSWPLPKRVLVASIICLYT